MLIGISRSYGVRWMTAARIAAARSPSCCYREGHRRHSDVGNALRHSALPAPEELTVPKSSCEHAGVNSGRIKSLLILAAFFLTSSAN